MNKKELINFYKKMIKICQENQIKAVYKPSFHNRVKIYQKELERLMPGLRSWLE